MKRTAFALTGAVLLGACSGEAPGSSGSDEPTTTISGSAVYDYATLPDPREPLDSLFAPGAFPVLGEIGGPVLLGVIDGFDAPESVLYDEDQDLWYVSMFTGSPGERDANGRIVRLDGENLAVRGPDWLGVADDRPFHAGRGMTLQGDTLWVADLDGVHGFHRESGEQLVFVDLSDLEPGFLNDLAAHPDGSVWVTDTGADRIIQVRPDAGVEVDVSGSAGSPNGILWDDRSRGFLLGSWAGTDTVFSVSTEMGTVTAVGVSPGTTRTDGLVTWWGMILGAVQGDSAIHVIDPDSGEGRRWIPLEGGPADIGIDRRRNRLLIPYVSRGLVEVWQLGDIRFDEPVGDDG